MKASLVLAAAAALIATPAMAEPTDTQKATMRYETAFLGLVAIDALQTQACLSRDNCHEANPLFGKHPSRAKMLGVSVLGGALHYTLVREINKTNPKFALRLAQFSVAVEGTNVALNMRFVF